MSDITRAVTLIRKYEGFNEKAYPDPYTGGEPYTFGYGTQFYPDGSPVRQGHLCSKEKALEYLFHEAHLIESQLEKLNLGLDGSMLQALISFVHSIGWESFLYSEIVDCIDREDFFDATQAMASWIFDEDHKVVGGLIDRRREEINLFLQEIDDNLGAPTEILLCAFRNYSASPQQVKAIRYLEENISPYILSRFANEFDIENSPWVSFTDEELDSIFTM